MRDLFGSSIDFARVAHCKPIVAVSCCRAIVHSSFAAAVKPCWTYFVISFNISIAATLFAVLKDGRQSLSNQPSPGAFRYQCASLVAASTGFRQLIVPARIGLLKAFARSRYSAIVVGGALPC